MDSHIIELSYGETVPVSVTLKRNGTGITLTGSTTTLSLVWTGESLGLSFAAEQSTSWDAGSTLAIEAFTCTNDADQSTNPGVLTFTPTTTFYTTVLPGVYRVQFTTTFADTSVQRFPRNIMESEYRLLVHPSIAGLND